MSLLDYARASGLALPAWLEAQPPEAIQATVPRAGWKWQGYVLGRVWPDGFTVEDYRLMKVGGQKRRLARPDAIMPDGRPHFLLTEREQRAALRLLDRYCLATFGHHNVACNAGRAVILSFLANSGGLAGVQYFAVGNGTAPTGTTAFDGTETQMYSEQFRKAPAVTSISGSQLDISTIFLTTEANFTFSEAGCWGDGASAALHSGTLFAHAPYTYPKTSAVTLTNDQAVTLS